VSIAVLLHCSLLFLYDIAVFLSFNKVFLSFNKGLSPCHNIMTLMMARSKDPRYFVLETVLIRGDYWDLLDLTLTFLTGELFR